MKHFVDFDYYTNEFIVKCTQKRFPGKYEPTIPPRYYVIPENKKAEYTDIFAETRCPKCIASMRLWE